MIGLLYIKRKIFILLIVYFIPVGLLSADSLKITYIGNIKSNITAPGRIAVGPDTNLYITEPLKGKVMVLTPSGELIRTINGLLKPLGIAVDINGKIYIGDDGDNRVKVYDKQGNFLFKFERKIRMPSDIAISPDGLIYVVDSKSNCVNVYNPDGSLAFSFGGYGTGPGEFFSPTGIYISSDSIVYVGDLGIPNTAGRIQKFDLTGNYLGEFGKGKFVRIQGLCVDNSERIYIVDAFQSTVEVMDTVGGSLGKIGDYGMADGLLMTPLDVAIDLCNRLFIASQDNGRIEIYGINGYTGMDRKDNVEVGMRNAEVIQILPNPFTKETVIRYSLNVSNNSRLTPCVLRIYDITGRLVKTLVDKKQKSGYYRVKWDGKDALGNLLPCGIYLGRIQLGNKIFTKKLVFLRWR